MKAFLFVALGILAVCAAADAVTLRVSPDDTGAYHTIAAAVGALPSNGGDILIAPGTYREKLAIRKDGVHIRGLGNSPQDTIIVWGDGAVNVGGTFRSATLDASGDDFRLDNLTVENDYSRNPAHPPSQAVALAVTGDGDVFTRIRLIGAQDTLYANKGAKGRMARQYFADCYIEGHVDFIFGNAKAFFERCELHGIAHQSVMFTAQSRNAPDEDSAYVFDHCTLTADPAAQNVALGRAWRPYATVIFLNTTMNAPVIPEGWREWHPGEADTLKTATYGEYHSLGPGANPAMREPYSHQLTDAEAAKWSRAAFFDGWAPLGIR